MANDGSVKIDITADDSDIKKKLNDVGEEAEEAADKLDDLGDSSKKSGKGFDIASVAIGNFISGGVTELISKVGEAISSLVALADETREYREDMAKLDTAFKSAGHSTETAQKAYDDFYKILGESDRSVEAVNHLAELTNNTEEVAKWSTIAAGVTAKFGDSLPLEGLTEAANETAKVGNLTGVLADALNWAGINEETFQKQLDKCNSEQERATLITNTLSKEYQAAAAEYNTLTASTQTAREATNRMEQAQAALGAAIEPLMTKWTNIKASLLEMVAEGLTPAKTATDELAARQREGVIAAHEAAAGYREIKTAAAEATLAQLADVEFATNTLIPQLQALVDANGNVKKGYEERAAFIMGQLNEALGKEYTRISEIIGKNGELTQSVNNAINAKKAQILLEGHEEAYITAIREKTAAEEAYYSQMSKYISLTSSIQEKEKELEGLRKQQSDALQARNNIEANEIKRKIDNIQSSVNIERSELAGLKKSYEQSEQDYKKYVDDITNYDEAKRLILEGNTEAAISYLNNLNAGYESSGSEAEKAANRDKAAAEDRLITVATKLTLLKEEFAANEKEMTEAQKTEMQNRIKAAEAEVEKFGTEAQKMGSNLVEGIGIGADGKKDWLSGKLGGIVSAAIETAKKVGIIKSPSRKMRDEVGKMLAAGIAVGIEEWADKPAEAIGGVYDAIRKKVEEEQEKNKKTAAKYQAEIAKITEEHNKEFEKIEQEKAEKLAELEEKLVEDKKKKNADKKKLDKDYAKSVEQLTKQYTEKLESLTANTESKIATNLDNIKNTITNKMQDIVALGDAYKDSVKQIWEDLDKSITDLQANYDNQLASRTASIASSLNLWDKATKNKVDGFDLRQNLRSQVKVLEDYNNAITKLEDRNVSTEFVNYLKTFGVGATGEIEAVVKMTDKQLSDYVGMWEKKNALAKDAAIEELEPLKAETEAKIAEVTNAALDKYAELRAKFQEQGALLMAELKQDMIDAGEGGYEEIVAQIDEYTTAGEDLLGGVVAGIVNKSPELAQAVTIAVNEAIAAAKEAAGIASPSKVMKKEVGANLAEGVNVGWEDKIDTVKDKMAADMQSITARIKTAVSIENARMAQGVGVRDAGFTEVAQAVGMQTAGINSLASEYRRGSNAQVTVPLILDGRELGRAVVELGNEENARIGTNLVLA